MNFVQNLIENFIIHLLRNAEKNFSESVENLIRNGTSRVELENFISCLKGCESAPD